MNSIVQFFPKLLDRTTMYRVVIYALGAVLLVAASLSFAEVLFATPLELGLSFLAVMVGSLVAHFTAVRLSGAPANIESSFITGFILFFILPPTADLKGIIILGAIGAAAVVLKYLIVFRKRHIFNPVAIVLVLVGVLSILAPNLGIAGADWWVGSRYLLPIVALAGLAIVMKTRRWTLVGVYFAVSVVTVVAFQMYTQGLPENGTFLSLLVMSKDILVQHFLSWPTVFFATVMVTEPLGLPSSRGRQAVFATIAGVLSSVFFSIGPVYSTPELALVVANLYTFLREFPARLVLHFTSKEKVGKDVYEYAFKTTHPVSYKAGQYMEWTLPHEVPDVRGVRRYFSLSSAPQDKEVRFAIRHVENGSSWKKSISEFTGGEAVYATQLSGDFVLNTDAKHHAFIAGGIGVTPFISMIRESMRSGESLSATLLYCVRTDDDLAFVDELQKAQETTGLVLVPVLEQPSDIYPHAIDGYLDREKVTSAIPQWEESDFYLSGPPGMVNAYKGLLKSMGIPRSRIHTDYFPGLA